MKGQVIPGFIYRARESAGENWLSWTGLCPVEQKDSLSSSKNRLWHTRQGSKEREEYAGLSNLKKHVPSILSSSECHLFMMSCQVQRHARMVLAG